MNKEVADFTSSLKFDHRIFQADIRCNQAHTTMLIEQEIIPSQIGNRSIKAKEELEKEGIKALKLEFSC
jgi:argininosuccinate lyase